MTLRVVELFSGIGAQRMALTLAGIPHEVVAIAEINKHALASYEAIYGDCPNLGDIAKVEALPPCDLVTYSFPCQDLSLAGKRAGMGEGTRSGLVWEVVRLLESAERERPEWLLMENVPQVLTSPLWPDLLARLSAMGYRNKWAKLDSSNFGSAQKRVRAFMVSRLNQDPPELPLSAPNAPRLCLRDVMEPERADRYVRRIPLDRVKWRTPKDGYKHPQSEGIECRLMDAGDPRLETRRIASEDSLCPALRTGCPQKAVEEEEEERVRPLVGTADNLRMAPKGRKAVGTVRDGEERLVVAPSDNAGVSTPIASIEGETFYSKAMLYSSSSSPTVRTEHGKNSQIKVLEDRPLEVIGEDMTEGQWKPHRYIMDGNGPCRNVGAYVNAAQRGIKVVADWQRGGMDQANRLYSSSSSPAIMCHGGGERDVKVVDESELVPMMKEGEVCPMLTPGRAKRQNGPRYRELGDKAFTVNCQDRHGAAEVKGGDLVVSILTPRECWRLMGFPEWAYLRASRVSSETQLYNQAGNSIVVEVLVAIFNAMFRPPKRRVQTTLEAVA